MTVASSSQALQKTWREQQIWSTTAGQIKRDITFWQNVALALASVGAIIVTAAAQLVTTAPQFAKLLSIIGAVVLALVPVVRGAKLGRDRVRNWIRSRSTSEGLKAEVYFYLTRTPPYDSPDRDERLASRRDEITSKVADLTVEAAAMQIDERPLPGPLDVSGYITLRINQQIDRLYRPQAQRNARLLKRARGLEFGLGISAAVFGALGAVKGLEGLGSWVAVLTTLLGAVTAHVAAARYESLVIEYQRTAHRLESLRDRWMDSNRHATPGAAAEFIKQCEDVISIENQAWMADSLAAKENSGKQSSEMAKGTPVT